MNFKELLPDFRAEEKYAELTPNPSEILVAAVITVAHVEKIGPTAAAEMVDRFIASRRRLITDHATNTDEVTRGAFAVALASFDAKLQELYGPVVYTEVEAESTRY